MNLELGPILRALRHARGAASLLVVEVALGLAVAVCAYTLGEWARGDDPRTTGLDEADSVMVRVLHATAPRSVEDADGQRREERARLRGVPGVRAVSAVRDAPILPIRPDVLEVSGASSHAFAWRIEADDDVSFALGLPVIAGRALAEADLDAPGEAPILLSEELASKLFPGGSAVGAHVRSRALQRDGTVVGIVGSFATLADPHDEPRSVFYYPIRPPLLAESRYLVRGAEGTGAALALRLEASLPSSGEPTLVSVESMRPKNPEAVNGRGAVVFARGIAVVAWCVVLLGALAASSFLVVERTKQIGIRRALGARRSDIVRYFLVENALLTGSGLALGASSAFGLDAAVHHFFPDARIAIDPKVVVVGAALFLIASLGAALVFALRAAGIRPTAALQRG